MATKPPAPSEEVAPAKPPNAFKEFLETSPPDIQVTLIDRGVGPYDTRGYGSKEFYRLATPELDLHCEYCEGTRAFKCIGGEGAALHRGAIFDELDYECKNCKEGHKYRKRFCLAIFGDGKSGVVQKIGEYPPYSPITSRKIYDLIGENHRQLFLKGRRAELRGLGIGAFAYYRRIVDNQKDLIIERLETVAKHLGASEETLKIFLSAKAQDQFTSAIKEIKDALPPALFIDTHNPLTLLYDLLSDGIHDLSDEECLIHARTVRTLLIALAERMSEIMKEDAKVKAAIGAFLSRKQPKP